MVTKNNSYFEETLNGKMGKTGQFWMTFTKAVAFIQSMQCAVKINDTALYSFALFEVTSIMFLTNHHNDHHITLDLAN